MATANAVIPADGFIGRQMRVEISGDNTSWTSAATVSFGDGITVGTVSVASPTDIFAEITIAPTATAGLRDVKVTDGGVDATLTQAFSITNPVTMTLQGTIASGSIALFTLTNHDFDNPFDTTSTQASIFSAPVFTNLDIAGPSGTTFQLGNVAPYSATGTVFLDLNATAGAVTIKSGPSGGTIVTSPTDKLNVTTRTATVLTSGTPAMQTVAKPFDSGLYELDVASAMATLARIKTSTTNATATPVIALLPASGSWADELTSGASVAQVTNAATKFYAVTFDGSGTSGFSYSVNAATAGLTVLNEVEPNNTVGQAQTAAMVPALYTAAAGSATLSDMNDVDMIKVTVPAGKAVHVITLSDDPQTDTVVDVQTTTGMSLGGPSMDQVYLDEFVSTPVTTPGTYVVKIFASSMFVAAHNTYRAAIFFE